MYADNNLKNTVHLQPPSSFTPACAKWPKSKTKTSVTNDLYPAELSFIILMFTETLLYVLAVFQSKAVDQ